MDRIQAILEDERRHTLGKLNLLRGSSQITGAASPGSDGIADEAEQAQASLRQYLEVAASERLVDRIARPNEAVQRLADGTYGNCEHCGLPIARGRRSQAAAGSDVVRGLPAGMELLGSPRQPVHA